MVDHPGCSLDDTKELLSFIKKNLRFQPEQVQVFTPTPSTYSTLMYYTQQDLVGNEIFVEKDRNARMKQKLIVVQGANKTLHRKGGFNGGDNKNRKIFMRKKYVNRDNNRKKTGR